MVKSKEELKELVSESLDDIEKRCYLEWEGFDFKSALASVKTNRLLELSIAIRRISLSMIDAEDRKKREDRNYPWYAVIAMRKLADGISDEFIRRRKKTSFICRLVGYYYRRRL